METARYYELFVSPRLDLDRDAVPSGLGHLIEQLNRRIGDLGYFDDDADRSKDEAYGRVLDLIGKLEPRAARAVQVRARAVDRPRGGAQAGTSAAGVD